jgi:hypothetical protein
VSDSPTLPAAFFGHCSPMTSYTLDVPVSATTSAGAVTTWLANPEAVPPEDTNL